MTTTRAPKVERRGLMQHLTTLCVRYVERFMPDPYLFAVILTVIVVALVALLVRGATPDGVLKAWYGGVWGSQKRTSSLSRSRWCSSW
jgi:short-chain fatty acids transporter